MKWIHLIPKRKISTATDCVVHSPFREDFLAFQIPTFPVFFQFQDFPTSSVHIESVAWRPQWHEGISGMKASVTESVACHGMKMGYEGQAIPYFQQFSIVQRFHSPVIFQVVWGGIESRNRMPKYSDVSMYP